MDILKISTKETADCAINDPRTGEPTDIVITVYGSDSNKFRALAKAAAQERIKNKSEVDSSTVEDDAKFLADLTQGWSGLEMGGKPLEFSKANAVKVYTLSAPIRNQVNQFIVRQANFLPPA
jgi:hypothetical protein